MKKRNNKTTYILLGIMGFLLLLVVGFYLNEHNYLQGVSTFSTKTSYPDGVLTFSLPQGWKVTESSDETKQTQAWWLYDYVITIQSPDLENGDPGSPCPAFGCSKHNGVDLVIADYGSNNFSSPKEWYMNRLNKKFPAMFGHTSTEYSDPSPVYSETNYLDKSAFCVDYSSSYNQFTHQFLQNLTTPYGIPKQIFTGACYILWKNKIYSVQASILKNNPNYTNNYNQTIAILRSIIFN